MTPLRSDNSVKWFIELRKTLNLHLSFYHTEYNSEIAKWKRCIRQGKGGRIELRVN